MSDRTRNTVTLAFAIAQPLAGMLDRYLDKGRPIAQWSAATKAPSTPPDYAFAI